MIGVAGGDMGRWSPLPMMASRSARLCPTLRPRRRPTHDSSRSSAPWRLQGRGIALTPAMW